MAMKKSSWPGGEHMHSSRAGRSEALRKTCGALAGTLTVSPARACRAADGDFDLAVEDGEHLFEVVAVWRRAAARRDMHVDEGVAAGGVVARQKDRVGVTHYPEVGQGRVLVRARKREISFRVVGRDRRGGLRRGA
jgi:hypothetical protein